MGAGYEGVDVSEMAAETCECGWPLDSFACRIRHVQINTGDCKAAND